MLQFFTVVKFVFEKVADRTEFKINFARTIKSITFNLYITTFQSSWLMGFDGSLKKKYASEEGVLASPPATN